LQQEFQEQEQEPEQGHQIQQQETIKEEKRTEEQKPKQVYQTTQLQLETQDQQHEPEHQKIQQEQKEQAAQNQFICEDETQKLCSHDTNQLGSFCLFVKNVHPSITEKNLVDAFGKFGSIISCTIKRKKTYAFAFVNYHSLEEAQQAMQAMDKSTIKGYQIKVEFSYTSHPPKAMRRISKTTDFNEMHKMSEYKNKCNNSVNSSPRQGETQGRLLLETNCRNVSNSTVRIGHQGKQDSIPVPSKRKICFLGEGEKRKS